MSIPLIITFFTAELLNCFNPFESQFANTLFNLQMDGRQTGHLKYFNALIFVINYHDYITPGGGGIDFAAFLMAGSNKSHGSHTEQNRTLSTLTLLFVVSN